jgi:hypothetical protein
MASTLNDKFAEGQAASMEQQLSNLAREAGIGPSVPPTGGLAPCGFRWFSVGSIHWRRCLVVVILR